MTDIIERATAWVARLFTRPKGRHRIGEPVPRLAAGPPNTATLPAPRKPEDDAAPLPGEEVPLVRAYVVAHEARMRQQRPLRRVLLVCSHLDAVEVR